MYWICCLFIGLLMQLPLNSHAQEGSRLQISLLTCTPGDELYSTFGHSAFRVIDSNSVTDLVYNYGTFNFEDEGFYLKFVQGKLLYYVSVENFSNFKYDYQSENRSITEQVLQLTAEEKSRISIFLNDNLKPENKYYKYDFFFDNCTTRLRDIIKKQHDSSFCKRLVMPAHSRFRQAIHEYLDKNDKDWSKLGIDILLGLPCDGLMTAEQEQFLPDNLMKSLDSSNQQHLYVASEKQLYTLIPTPADTNIFNPFTVFSLFLLFVVLLDFFSRKQTGFTLVKGILTGLDGLIFFLTGTLGIILIFMWLGTDHSMCKNNFNLLWAFPPHFIMAFFVNSKKAWVKKYFGFNSALLILLLISWFFLPQQLNTGLIPFVLLLLYRSALIARA